MTLTQFLNGQAHIGNEIRNYQAEHTFLIKGLEEGTVSKENFIIREEDIKKHLNNLYRQNEEMMQQAFQEKLFEVKLSDLYEELKKVCPPPKSQVKFQLVFLSTKQNYIKVELYLEKERNFRFYINKSGQDLSSDKKYEFPAPNLLINIHPSSDCMQDEYFGKAVLNCAKLKEKKLDSKTK